MNTSLKMTAPQPTAQGEFMNHDMNLMNPRRHGRHGGGRRVVEEEEMAARVTRISMTYEQD